MTQIAHPEPALAHDHCQLRRLCGGLALWCIIQLLCLNSPSWAQEPAACHGWPLWEEFKSHHLRSNGRVVDDTPEGERSTSEGQAYALFFSLVAGDQANFARILQWSDQHLAQNQLGRQLMAWLWHPNGTDGLGQVQDPNAATDADLWMAYSLTQAAQLWSAPDWDAQGQRLRQSVLEKAGADLPNLGPVLLPGIWGFDLSQGRWRLNPSYAPPFVMDRLFASASERTYRAASLRLLLEPLEHFGYAPDWVFWDRSTGWQADSGWGSYDAIRVYLWLALGASTVHQQGCARSKPWLDLMARADGGLDHWPAVTRIQAEILAATPLYEAGPGFSATQWALAESCGHRALAENFRRRLMHQMENGQRGYYQRALLLFATGWLEGRFHFDARGELHVTPPQRSFFSRPDSATTGMVRGHAAQDCKRRS